MLERIITALVLVAVVLSCMFATQSHYPMFMLMIVAAGVAGYEWFKLMPRKTKYVLKPVAWGFGVLTAALAATALYFRDICLITLGILYFDMVTQHLLGQVLPRIRCMV